MKAKILHINRLIEKNFFILEIVALATAVVLLILNCSSFYQAACVEKVIQKMSYSDLLCLGLLIFQGLYAIYARAKSEDMQESHEDRFSSFAGLSLMISLFLFLRSIV